MNGTLIFLLCMAAQIVAFGLGFLMGNYGQRRRTTKILRTYMPNRPKDDQDFEP